MVTVSHRSWTYLSDRPVGLDGDLLWQDEIIKEQIFQIAERVVSPLYPNVSHDELSSSITFAIHGQWGMGKSSALRMIREEAENLAKKNDVSDRLKFCEYIAPAESLPYDARTTLAVRILTAVAGSPREAIEQFLPDSLAIDLSNDSIPRGEDTGRTSRTLRIIEKMATALSGLLDFAQIVDERLNKKAHETHVLVVLIDDLDRCKTDFIWHVLDSIQQLSDIRNIFFVLAVDQERLRKAIEERFEGMRSAVNPDYALEKYIQHAVSVPDMDEDRAKAFLEALMQKYKEKDSVSKAIVENFQFFQYVLRALTQNVGRILTPRSIKRYLNMISPDLARKLPATISPEEQQKVAKEWVLEHAWPDFYRNYFLPTRSQEGLPVQNAFRALETACRDFSRDKDVARLRFQLNKIFDRFNLNWKSTGLDLTKPDGLQELVKLATYLGTPPYWLIRKSPEEQEQDVIFKTIEGSPALDIIMSELAPGGDQVFFTESDLENEFETLYIRSETAEAADQRAEALQAAESLFNLVKYYRAHFKPRHASIVGNIAMTAQYFRAIDLATKLYELALELDPEHSNNLQNFVDFIVKAPVSYYYAKADEYIRKLKTGKHAQHRPLRTLALEARLRSLTGQGTDQFDQTTVKTLVDEFLRDPSDQERYISLMALLEEIGDFETLRRVARALYTRATNDNEQYLAVLGLADMLGTSPNDRNELEVPGIYRNLLLENKGAVSKSKFLDLQDNPKQHQDVPGSTDTLIDLADDRNELEAMDMYRYLLDNARGSIAESRLPDILHHYAALLYKHNYSDQAGRIWFEAYKFKPTDRNIRRAYSLYLLRTSRPDLAAIVSEGKPLEEMILQPAQKKLPVRFLEDTEHWWEQ